MIDGPLGLSHKVLARPGIGDGDVNPIRRTVEMNNAWFPAVPAFEFETFVGLSVEARNVDRWSPFFFSWRDDAGALAGVLRRRRWRRGIIFEVIVVDGRVGACAFEKSLASSGGPEFPPDLGVGGGHVLSRLAREACENVRSAVVDPRNLAMDGRRPAMGRFAPGK